MDKDIQVQKTQQFRSMHDRTRVLLLPNAWDAGSARLFAQVGFPAIATTSGGIAWALGYGDGEQLPLDDLLAAIRRIVRVTALPVTVDFEAGYADTIEILLSNVTALINAGIVGLNLEDGIRHESLREIDLAASRIAATRAAADAAGVPIFINARVDSWIVAGDADDAARMDDSLRRARAYLAAGADGIYPIGVADPALIATLCAKIDAPVNISARAGLPDMAELARLGVARVSTATRLATLALSAAHTAAHSLHQTGRFDGLDATFGYEDAQRLFPHC